MGFEDYISEQEATGLTGMSQATLLRFAEAGYLKLEQDGEGLRLFSKAELSNLFGVRSSTKSLGALTPMAKSAIKEAATSQAAPAQKGISTPEEPIENEAQVRPASQPTDTSKGASAHEQLSDKTTNTEAKDIGASLEREIQSLRNVISLQEKILDFKDQELSDLKNQREWLKQRIEKLEDKSDRDQVLLLTETQTIRNLVNLNQKRSPVRHALEWLGFADSKNEAQFQASYDVSHHSSSEAKN